MAWSFTDHEEPSKETLPQGHLDESQESKSTEVELSGPPKACELSSDAEDPIHPEADEADVKSHKKAAALLKTWVAKIPGLGSVFNDYLEVVGLDQYSDPGAVGGSNEGLVNHYTKLAETDSALKAKAANFYADIKKIDEPQGDNASRPTISDTSTKVGREPGWVWTLALKHSGGDPNLAMRLIGMCGHDDLSYLALERPLTTSERKKQLQDLLESRRFEIENEKSIYRTIQEQIKSGNVKGDELAQLLEDQKASLQRMNEAKAELAQTNLEQVDKTITENVCPPQASVFYYPQSLGKDVDLSSQMKERIKTTQHDKVPAKYYHVYGSAAVSCELIERGHDPRLVSVVEQLAAWSYRTIRMNKDVCSADAKIGVTGDAAVLMSRQALGGQTIPLTKIQIPQFNLRIEAPKFLDQFGPTRMLRKPFGWSDERYDQARAKMQSLWTDWEWTRQQHEIGSKFAADHCKKKGPR